MPAHRVDELGGLGGIGDAILGQEAGALQQGLVHVEDLCQVGHVVRCARQACLVSIFSPDSVPGSRCELVCMCNKCVTGHSLPRMFPCQKQQAMQADPMYTVWLSKLINFGDQCIAA